MLTNLVDVLAGSFIIATGQFEPLEPIVHVVILLRVAQRFHVADVIARWLVEVLEAADAGALAIERVVIRGGAATGQLSPAEAADRFHLGPRRRHRILIQRPINHVHPARARQR